jgi:hypothetical protein
MKKILIIVVVAAAFFVGYATGVSVDYHRQLLLEQQVTQNRQ